MSNKYDLDFSLLVGETITDIQGCEADSDCITITLASGAVYKLNHHQDCCENVEVNDVCGDVSDLLNTPIVVAECVAGPDNSDYGGEYSCSYTWTFYKLDTNKGGVTIRWLGESDGDYSEEVSFDLVSGASNAKE